MKIEPNQGPRPIQETPAVEDRTEALPKSRGIEGTSVTYSQNLKLLQQVTEAARAAAAVRPEAVARAKASPPPTPRQLAEAMLGAQDGKNT